MIYANNIPVMGRRNRPVVDMRIARQSKRAATIPFPGWGYLAGKRWYDSALTADTTGAAITDNSTASAKTWIKVDILNNTVTYEDSAVFLSGGRFPDGVEYFETAYQFSPFHVFAR